MGGWGEGHLEASWQLLQGDCICEKRLRQPFLVTWHSREMKVSGFGHTLSDTNAIWWNARSHKVVSYPGPIRSSSQSA